MVTIVALQPSPLVDPLPEIGAAGRSSLVVDPADDRFTGWDDVFGLDPVDDYLLAPGDYRGWGACGVGTTNAVGRRRTIRFVDSGRRPWDRPAEQALVAGFEFTASAARWVVQGLTLRGRDAYGCHVSPQRGAHRVRLDTHRGLRLVRRAVPWQSPDVAEQCRP